MSAEERPLLERQRSDRSPSSEDGDPEDQGGEEAGLRGGTGRGNYDRYQRLRELGLFAWALIATVVIIVLAVVIQHERGIKHSDRGRSGDGPGTAHPAGKRNMIFMVSDGMGPASLSLTRSYRQYQHGLPYNNTLVLDKHLIGSSRTRSSSSLVTDSAAGATAFGCGHKSYNGAIAVLPDESPCGTVLEAAKAAGYMTGLVVTTRITDATPACFASHAVRRDLEDLIAEHLIGNYPLGRTVDLILGGGRCHFLPNTTKGSCRGDSKDVLSLAQDNGFSYIDSKEELDNLDFGTAVKLPLLGLVASTDIPFEIDRIHSPELYPSQAEMTKLALKALSAATKDSDKGFFLMVEGSLIDHTGHANDPAAQVHEVLAHDEAFAEILDFVKNDDNPGVLVGTSDHETGGLTTALELPPEPPGYYWLPEVLARASHSTVYLQDRWMEWLDGEGSLANRHIKRNFVLEKLIREGLGIEDATDADADTVIDAGASRPAAFVLSEIISNKARVGWTTHGHTGTFAYFLSLHPSFLLPFLFLPSPSHSAYDFQSSY